MGFRLAGLKVRDIEGELEQNYSGESAYSKVKCREDVKKVLSDVFRSNGQVDINENAVEDSIEFV